jgi:hypothetical protein
MAETPIPPKQTSTDPVNDDLPASRPSAKTLLTILLVLAALCSIPVIIFIVVWSNVR